MGIHYDEIGYWAANYGRSGVPDQRAAQDYIDCETDERIQILQSQIHAIAKGKFDDAWMDQNIGGDRKMKHGSYERWAELMLLWISSYNKKA